nr:hypothetical protein [uncultured Moellerella sp.]
MLVSLRLHRLKEKGLVLPQSNQAEWLVYINGIPVKETRNELTNPCFAFEQDVSIFFLRAISIKLIIQLSALIMLVQQTLLLDYYWLIAIAIMVELFIAYRCYHSIIALKNIIKGIWLIEAITTKSESQWYRGNFIEGERKIPALDVLLKL